jgi:hypothetical protein
MDRSAERPPYRRRRLVLIVTLGLVAILIWLAVSLGGALTDPALGSSFSARFAEWARGPGTSSPCPRAGRPDAAPGPQLSLLGGNGSRQLCE